MPAWPGPTSVVQSRLGPSVGQAVSHPFSFETPLWSGPRQLGQSAASVARQSMTARRPAAIAVLVGIVIPLAYGGAPGTPGRRRAGYLPAALGSQGRQSIRLNLLTIVWFNGRHKKWCNGE